MIRFYIDGTAGQKDGTEVTSINPITVTGLFPAETIYEITVQDDRFLPILEDTVFHANVDYLILLDLI